jgi:alkylation response protein AidB-like acyl-CoA dehydrogenase
MLIAAAPPAISFTPTAATAAGDVLFSLLADELRSIGGEADRNDRSGTFAFEAFRRLRSAGVLGATVPVEFGGLGVSHLGDIATALAMVSAADASTALALHVQFSRGLTLTYESQYGSAPVRQLAVDLLRQMATGDAAICGAVKDHHASTTRLVPDGDGGWLLTGRKTLVTMAPIGTHFVVYAREQAPGRADRLTAVVLRRTSPGLTVFDNWDGLGMRASGTDDIAFDRCPIAAADVLARGPVDVHDDAALAGQTVSSITMLGIYIGIAEAARALAIARVSGRGAPAAAICTLITDIDARLYALRATAAAALANAESLAANFECDPAERGRRMMVPFQYAKLTVNELSQAIINDCMTIVGGSAFSGTHPLSRLYRDVRAGWFMQPYTYPDSVDFLSGHALHLDRANNYMKQPRRPVAVSGQPNPKDCA